MDGYRVKDSSSGEKEKEKNFFLQRQSQWLGFRGGGGPWGQKQFFFFSSWRLSDCCGCYCPGIIAQRSAAQALQAVKIR